MGQDMLQKLADLRLFMVSEEERGQRGREGGRDRGRFKTLQDHVLVQHAHAGGMWSHWL